MYSEETCSTGLKGCFYYSGTKQQFHQGGKPVAYVSNDKPYKIISLF